MQKVLRIWRILIVACLVVCATGMMHFSVVSAQEGGAAATATPGWPVGTYAPPVEAPVTPIPSPAPQVLEPAGDDVLNILLLGSDTANPSNAGRTDAIMVASINRTKGAVNLLSIPRDLFVYIPGWTMQRINTAYGYGENGPRGDGIGLLKDVLLYNLGISIDFYARVDFNGFQAVVDALGGVELTIDCALQDWQLIEPDLDPNLEENWHLVTLPVGVHTLDGYEALWYARSRRTSSDFDRGRRQQELLRAIWRRTQELGLLAQIPALWPQVNAIVETDMQLDDLLGLVPLAAQMSAIQVSHFTLEPGVHVRSWRTPGGSSVLLPIPETVAGAIRQFLQPPTRNQLVQSRMRVEVVNATGYRGMDQIAVDRLAWEGVAAAAVNAAGVAYEPASLVYDFSGQQKDSLLSVLLETLRLPESAAILNPLAERAVDYRVVLGGDFRACIHNVMPPVPTPTSEALDGG